MVVGGEERQEGLQRGLGKCLVVVDMFTILIAATVSWVIYMCQNFDLYTLNMCSYCMLITP